jgi:predicted nucleic acid-binding protein/GNAT superfamily N-acetyltransferase
MKYNIHNIKDVPGLIDEVVALGDSQKRTLGFLAEQAFFDYADKGNILVAVSDKGHVIGYVLFAQKRNLACRLSHVCVQPDCRKEGVAAALVSELKKHTAQMRRITLKCRRDYGIDLFWQKNGFTAVGETKGRGKDRNTLTIWEFSLQQTLLSLAPEVDKTMVVIDLNIVIAAMVEGDRECESLLSFTYADEIDYRVSNHSYAEVNKSDSEERRKATRQCLDSFSRISACPEEQLVTDLIKIVGEKSADDAHQIASAIYNDASCFITNDAQLTRSTNIIAAKYGTHIYSPTEFIINYCNGNGRDLYFPGSLPQSEIRFRPIPEFALDDCFNRYRGDGERKNNFKQRVTINQPDVTDYSFVSIEIDDVEIGLYACSVNKNLLTIQLLRLDRKALHKHTINSHIIEKILQGAVDSGVSQIEFIDTECGKLVETGLLDAGFKRLQDKYTKPIVKGFISANEALKQIGMNEVDEGLSEESLLDLERLFWPAKIRELSLPASIIPIKSKWARELITSMDSQMSLFGAPDKILQTRRVYYRSTGQSTLVQPPGRIIWYVSGESKIGSTKCVVATSVIDEVEIAPVKKLFAKYERFGVYKWQDVCRTAKNEIDKKIMAITFSKTEVFKNFIGLHQIANIIKKHENRNLNPVSPYAISQKTFNEIYELGIDA